MDGSVCPWVLSTLLKKKQYVTKVHKVATKVLESKVCSTELKGNEVYIDGIRMPLFASETSLDLNLVHEDGFFSFPYRHARVQGKVISERISNFAFTSLGFLDRGFYLLQFYYLLDRLRTKADLGFVPAPDQPLRYRKIDKKYVSYDGIYRQTVIHDVDGIVPVFFFGRIVENVTLEEQNENFRAFLFSRPELDDLTIFAEGSSVSEMVEILASISVPAATRWEITDPTIAQTRMTASTRYDNLEYPEIFALLDQPDCREVKYLLGNEPIDQQSGCALAKAERHGQEMTQKFEQGLQPKQVFDCVKRVCPSGCVADYAGKKERYRLKESKVCDGFVAKDVRNEFLLGKKYLNQFNYDLDCFAHTVSGYTDYHHDSVHKDVPKFVVVQENVHGKGLDRCLGQMDEFEFGAIAAQVVAILQHCNEKMYYSHGNCQPRNVMLRPSETDEIKIPLELYLIKIKSKHQVVLVDYEKTYISPPEQGCSARNAFGKKKTYSRPFEDIFVFLIMSGRIAQKEGNEKVLRAIMQLLVFFELVDFVSRETLVSLIMGQKEPQFPAEPQNFEKDYSIRHFIEQAKACPCFKKAWCSVKKQEQ